MKKITMYKTKDGKIFDTIEKAEEYTIDKVRKVIGTHLTNIHEKHPEFNKTHTFDIIMYLVKDYDKAEKLINDLKIAMDYLN